MKPDIFHMYNYVDIFAYLQHYGHTPNGVYLINSSDPSIYLKWGWYAVYYDTNVVNEVINKINHNVAPGIKFQLEKYEITKNDYIISPKDKFHLLATTNGQLHSHVIREWINRNLSITTLVYGEHGYKYWYIIQCNTDVEASQILINLSKVRIEGITIDVYPLG